MPTFGALRVTGVRCIRDFMGSLQGLLSRGRGRRAEREGQGAVLQGLGRLRVWGLGLYGFMV